MGGIRFENASYRIYGDLPAVGSRAPDLSLVNAKLQNVSLANWSGKRKILNILISIDSETSARSVIRFDRIGRDHEDVALLMVSCDLPFAHRRFAAEHGLESAVGLSAVRHAGFGENYGMQILEGPLEGMFAPAVVVLDENNTIVHHERIEDIKTEPDYRAAFRALGIEIDE